MNYADDKTFERLKNALVKYGLGTELIRPLQPIKAGEKVLVAIDAKVEDTNIRAAIAKIAFNYLAYIRGRDFASWPMFNAVRNLVFRGTEPTIIVTKSSPLTIHGDNLEAARRKGYIVALDLARDRATLNGYVEFVGLLAYRVKLGIFGPISIPISSGHYYDILSKTVIKMSSFQPPPNFYVPSR
jgi:hypothetical protein